MAGSAPTKYSVTYSTNSQKFTVSSSWSNKASGDIDVLVETPNGLSALQFSELLNVTIEPKYRLLFALGLQSFYTDCIAGALHD